ncbi:MAG: methyltransferase domain-containing protein [Woeseiaceae bacterium]|nr:methyltransferase domain-containing protein [Woeseiaceae bacterium]
MKQTSRCWQVFVAQKWKADHLSRATLEEGSDRYWKYLEDWSDSWQRLLDEGLIEGDESGYSLTERGRPLAEQYYAERPDHFWYYYQHYYPAAQASRAHSQLCEWVFGKDLTQDGQADMDTINDLISYLQIGEGDKVLDLGCGAGGISEYVADETGAFVTGLDYAESAITTALDRTRSKRGRLDFVQGDMNALEFADHSFDKVISLDTIYWVAEIDAALASILRLLRPAGRFAISITVTPEFEDGPDSLEPDGTWVACSLQGLGVNYEVHDDTQRFLSFWPKLKQAALELRDDFVAEGNEIMFDSFMHDADDDYLPAAEAGKLYRYHYIVSV